MSMTITNNVRAVNTTRQLNTNNRNLSKSLERLSSGYRINVGADGPADLVISEQLRAQINGLERAVKNTQEAQNVIGIAEGALNEMNNILKSMRSLALHAANSGVTSPMQMAADQAEVDSSIQTIDRIATTTKFSDQFLLNGNKSITYDRDTKIRTTNDHALLDTGLSRLDQVFRTKGYSINISFTGLDSDDNAIRGNMAQKAYFEAHTGTTGTQIGGTGGVVNTQISADQRFEVSGNKGSRLFSFANGTHLGEIAKSINDLADSTGVAATLIFGSGVEGSETAGASAAANALTARAAGGLAEVYTVTATGAAVNGGATTGVASGVVVGKNTDGDGRLWVKWEETTAGSKGTVYKDRAMTMEVGTFADTAVDAAKAFTASNGSGLSFDANFNGNGGVATGGNVTMIQLGTTLEFDDTGVNASQMTGAGTINIRAELERSMVSGVRLGYNTDDTGNLYFRIEAVQGSTDVTINAYKDANMTADSLVAKSIAFDGSAAGQSVRLTEVDMGTNGPKSGIFATLTFNAPQVAGNRGTLTFNELGLRLSSTEYGSNEYVRVQQLEGNFFTDTATNTLVEAGDTGRTVVQYGNDASVTVNGLKLDMKGVEALVSTQDLNANLVFNAGSLGKTTIAVAGYNDGAVASRAGQVGTSGAGNNATHALSNTGEVLKNLQGGMQFQLGEGAGAQERTTYSIQSMTVSNLGRINHFADYGSGTMEYKMISMQDMLGGGLASLATDAIKALHIIDQAIQDVSDLRARLGAFQSNMLQTNANNLGVTIENLVKTESGIRDSDMAYETTQFTKNQIMTSAATAMLAQANAAQQQVLQLLG